MDQIEKAVQENSQLEDSQEITFAKRHKIFLIVIILLFLLSVAALSFCLVDYAQQDKREVALKVDNDAEVNIFSAYYTGANGEIVVQSADNNKVIAPGTKGEHLIRLRNADEYAIDYEIDPNVKFLSGDRVPLLVRMRNVDGNYLLGSATEWASLQALREFSHKGTLKKAEAGEFVFEWQWPYESGNDEQDTQLGNQQNGAGVEIGFAFHSVANTSLAANGGWDGHPDHGKNIVIAVAVGVLFIVTIIAIILVIKKRKEELENAVDEMPMPEPAPQRVEQPQVPAVAEIDLALLDMHFAGGAFINIVTLKQMGIVPISASRMHITASPGYTLNKTFVVMTQSISSEARRSIMAAGGVVLITPN